MLARLLTALTIFAGAPPAMTLAPNFEAALTQLLLDEGGWYDGSKSHDPNPTYQGVTQGRYDAFRDNRGLPRRTVREMEAAEMRAIYRTYWQAVKADQLGQYTAHQLFDHAVNRGPVAAIRVLQRAVGVEDDGVFGPATMAAALHHNDLALAQRVVLLRVRDYCGLARANPKKLPALATWVERSVGYGLRLPACPTP